MKNKKSFQQAISETPDIHNCFKSGLQALGAHASKISLADPRVCNGSLEIDKNTRPIYPNDHRWDYAFSYNKDVFFVEVHGAKSDEISTMEDKLKWLKAWLHHHAPEINKLKHPKTPFYWIQSNGYHIINNAKYNRRIAQLGLKPIAKLIL